MLPSQRQKRQPNRSRVPPPASPDPDSIASRIGHSLTVVVVVKVVQGHTYLRTGDENADLCYVTALLWQRAAESKCLANDAISGFR